jgi:hypothetical protein
MHARLAPAVQRHVPQGGRELPGPLQFRLGAVRFAHRRRRVDRQLHRNRLLPRELSDQELLQPGVGGPVDVPELVAGRVFAVASHLHRGTWAARGPVPLPWDRPEPPDCEPKLLDPFQELVAPGGGVGGHARAIPVPSRP